MRIALVDLLFRWPPDSGAYVDLCDTASLLSRHHEVGLFVATIGALAPWPRGLRLGLDRTKFFRRGTVDRALPFAITPVPFTAVDYRPRRVVAAFRRALERFRPDRVMIANGWQMKAHLVLGLREFDPLLRLYAYEGLCLRAGMPYRRGAVCPYDYLDGRPAAWARCAACAVGFLATYPSPAYLHEAAAAGALRPGYRDLVRDALGAARCVIAYSDAHAARARPYARRLAVVPHGVARDRFPPTPPPPAPPVRFLVPGRVEQTEKGGRVLVEAGRRLWRRRRDFELWLTSRRWREPFVRPVGFVRHEELGALYGQVHAVVVPSVWPEPFGIVAVEGLMAGRPVVASRVGGLPDIVDESCGVLVPPGDPEVLAIALEQLIADADRRARLGAAGRVRALAEFDLDAVHTRCVRPLFAEAA